MDRLRALEVFIAVADAGSLAAAARGLSLSAPTVTRILGEFEIELGVLLFHRTTRALTLTDPGKNFLEDARRIVTQYQEASDAVKGAHRAPTGLLRVTAPNLFGTYYILPVILTFMKAYQGVTVETIFLDRIVNIVEEGIDLAIRIGELEESSMMAIRVGTVRRVICASQAYLDQYGTPQVPEDLRQHHLIATSSASARTDWHFKQDKSIRIKPRFFSSSVPAAIEAAKMGGGLTRALSYQLGPALGNGGLQTVLQEYEPDPLPIHIVHAQGRSASAKVRAFVDMACEKLRSNSNLNF